MSAKTLKTAALLVSLAVSPAFAGESLQLIEQEIKAGLLYNFLKYTDWPESPVSAPAVVCLLGGDPFAGKLQPMAGRSVNQHTIQLRDVAAIADTATCTLLFVHADAKAQWPTLKADLANRPMLTVSDFAGFSDAGGMIEFTRADNRIGVKINAEALSAAHLHVQDRLLKLASAATGASGAKP